MKEAQEEIAKLKTHARSSVFHQGYNGGKGYTAVTHIILNSLFRSVPCLSLFSFCSL